MGTERVVLGFNRSGVSKLATDCPGCQILILISHRWNNQKKQLFFFWIFVVHFALQIREEADQINRHLLLDRPGSDMVFWKCTCWGLITTIPMIHLVQNISWSKKIVFVGQTALDHSRYLRFRRDMCFNLKMNPKVSLARIGKHNLDNQSCGGCHFFFCLLFILKKTGRWIQCDAQFYTCLFGK